MSNLKNNMGLSISIVFASLLLAGSITFFAFQMDSKADPQDLQAEIKSGIEEFVKNAEKEAQEAAQKAAEEANKPQFVEGDFTDDDAVLGDKNAPVTMVEFSDFQCPYCARFNQETFPEIKEKYIDTGKVKFIHRDYPLQSHPAAYPASLLAECTRDQAGDEAYFEIVDELYAGLGGGFDYDKFADAAIGLGADATKLKDCFDNDKFKDEIDKDLQDGIESGIRGTPGFIVNGNLISGAQPFESFEKVIEAELAK